MNSGPDAGGERTVSPALVGRDSELAALVTAVRTAPAVVTVEGEAGVGKTRLVSELRGRPELAGRRLLIGRCHQIRESFPLGPVVEAVRGAETELSGLRLSPVAGALRPLLPELAKLLPAAPAALADPAAERHRVFRGVVALLTALPPVVLVLEDLHWAEEQTVELLGYLLADQPAGLALVLTFRGEVVSPTIRELTARLPAGTTHARLELASLDQHATGSLAAAILGADRVPDELVGYLWDRTAGLPLAVEEVLALVRARGLLAPASGRWTRRRLERLGVPHGIRDSTLARIERLPPAAQRVAEAAAVLQSASPPPVLDAMTDRAGTTAELAEVIRSGLFTEQEDLIGFRHVLAAQAVYESLTGPRRRELHGRAAAALAALEPAPLGRIAHHLKHAGQLAQWSSVAEAAADQAIGLAHEAEAVRLLEEVLRRASLTEFERGRIAVKLGWAAVDTLHAREVIEPLTKALRPELSGAVRGELRLLLAVVLGQAGEDPVRQRQLLRAAVGDLRTRPDLRAWAMVALAVTTQPEVPLSEDVGWATRAVGLVDEVDDPLLQVFILGKAGSVLLDTGARSWRTVVDRVLKITGGGPRYRREVNAHYSLGVAACYTGHLSQAEPLLASGLRSPATQQNQRLEIMLRSGVAVLHYCLGRWDGLGDEVAELLSEVADYATIRIDLELVAGGLAIAQGALDDARTRLQRATAAAIEIFAYEVVPMAAGSSARTALALGDPEAALTWVRRLVEVLDAKGVWAQVGWALPVAVETLLATGRRSEAAGLADRVERELADLDAPLTAAALGEARGLLAAAAGDPAAAATQLRAAAERYDALPAPYQGALARERAAECMLDRGGDSAAVLRAAAVTYQRLGATRDYARAAGLARQHGVGLPARHRGGRRGYGTALSPREREVASLAARGRANKQIAHELFISASTVEKHLVAAMRKLRVRSRAELAHRLADGGSKDSGFPQ